LQYAKKQVPFNLIAFGLEGAKDNLEEPPVPKMEHLVVLSLLLPTEEAIAHFKLWYEADHLGMNFERDLLMPLLTYWGWYRGEHPHLRGIDFGKGSISAGTAALLETPFARKYNEPAPDQYDDYSWLVINKAEEDEEEDEEMDSDNNQPMAPVGQSPSAKIYG